MERKNKINLFCTVNLLLILSGCFAAKEKISSSIFIVPEEHQQETVISKPSLPSEQQNGSEHLSASAGFSPLWTPLDGCEAKKKVAFMSPPLDIPKITAIEPQGELTGFRSGHITPGDHVGFRYDHTASSLDVYALADGYLVRVERNHGYFGIGGKNYHLYIEYSCSLFGSYVHLTELDPALLTADEKLRTLNALANVSDNQRNLLVRIPLKAGQVIGQTEEWGLLGMLTVDTTVTLSGFENQKLYSGEPWKTHAVSPFNYFSESLKKQLMMKNPRTKEPKGGKIDFDQPGKLVGNWFKQGTDYAGNRSKPFCGDYICPYWEGHLSFVYDYIDQQQIRLSIGYDAGLADEGPYGVKGNSPDPGTVKLENGLVKYELVKLNDLTAARGFPAEGKPLITENSNHVLGTLLVQMLEPRKIKMEVFPGKTKEQVSGFNEKAKVYYR